MDMMRKALKCAWLLMALAVLPGCTDWMYDDRTGCEHGVWVSFKYDYNLQRADMFGEHVGGVTVYVFDDEGNFVTSRSESNTSESRPLAEPDYRMYLDLPAGSYRFLALAQQNDHEASLNLPGAKFRRAEIGEGDTMDDFSVTLDCAESEKEPGMLEVAHGGLPLDTLWHGLNAEPLEVPSDRYVYQEIPLVRNTKYINVTLRDIDTPDYMDVADYDFRIYDSNRRLRYDNGVDESDDVLYTPFVTWNTYDPSRAQGAGTMAHADFMTSRIIKHDGIADDARLVVTNRETGNKVIDVNLPDLLSRMANYDELHRYSAQEFLDRGYDYELSFFLSGGQWSYVNISIGVLGWTKRIQNISF